MKVYKTDESIIEIGKKNLFFLKEIENKLKLKSFNKDKDKSCTVLISSKEVGYSPKVINTIEKFYTKNNWTCRLTHFYKTEINKIYCYTFKFTRNE